MAAIAKVRHPKENRGRQQRLNEGEIGESQAWPQLRCGTGMEITRVLTGKGNSVDAEDRPGGSNVNKERKME
jgi:hypothetical protein